MFSDYTRKVTMQNLFHDGGFSFTGMSEKAMESTLKHRKRKIRNKLSFSSFLFRFHLIYFHVKYILSLLKSTLIISPSLTLALMISSDNGSSKYF